MTDEQFRADASRELAEEIRLGKLAYLQSAEYIAESHAQEMRRQRTAIVAFGEYWEALAERRREQMVESDERYADPRRA